MHVATKVLLPLLQHFAETGEIPESVLERNCRCNPLPQGALASREGLGGVLGRSLGMY